MKGNIKKERKLAKEQNIINKFRAYNKTEEIAHKYENNLTQTLVHSAYNARQHNRGSPTVFKKHLHEDFDLDR